MSILTLSCMIFPDPFLPGLRSRIRRRFGCVFRVFLYVKFLHDICELFETPSLPVRECFNTQVPILTSKQWLQEVWLPICDVQESPSWYQYAHHFSEIPLNVFPDVVRWIPHRAMEPIGLIEVSMSQTLVGA